MATTVRGRYGVVCPYPRLARVVCPSPRHPAGMTAATITFMCAPEPVPGRCPGRSSPIASPGTFSGPRPGETTTIQILVTNPEGKN
jgi:hypothetical protein